MIGVDLHVQAKQLTLWQEIVYETHIFPMMLMRVLFRSGHMESGCVLTRVGSPERRYNTKWSSAVLTEP